MPEGIAGSNGDLFVGMSAGLICELGLTAVSREKLNSTQIFRYRGHRATGSSQMPEQNVSIKNRTTAGVPQCTAGSAYGSYGLYGNQA